MNAIQMKERVDLYIDRSRNARFSFYNYAVAMRDAQTIWFDKYKVSEQGIRENLYTLLKSATPTVTNVSTTSRYKIDRISYPTDYRFFVAMINSVDGSLMETKSASWGRWNNILTDDFLVPTNNEGYQLEDASGWLIAHGPTGTLTVSLEYLIDTSDFSVGNESDLINPGGSVLTNGVSYIATEESVQNSVKYQPGVQFTAVGTSLTSGQVIPVSVIVNSNLPPNTHEDLCKLCAEILLGTVKDYQGSQFADKQYKEAGN